MHLLNSRIKEYFLACRCSVVTFLQWMGCVQVGDTDTFFLSQLNSRQIITNNVNLYLKCEVLHFLAMHSYISPLIFTTFAAEHSTNDSMLTFPASVMCISWQAVRLLTLLFDGPLPPLSFILCHPQTPVPYPVVTFIYNESNSLAIILFRPKSNDTANDCLAYIHDIEQSFHFDITFTQNL